MALLTGSRVLLLIITLVDGLAAEECRHLQQGQDAAVAQKRVDPKKVSRNRFAMAVIWLLYAETAACDPGEARGHFYGRAGCAELSQFLTLSALVLAAT